MSLAELAAKAAPKPPAGIVLARRAAGGETEVVTSGPADPDAAYELGSITKAVTGLLLADAVTRGEVTLETPLSACLPTPSAITLGALASHTSGLPRLPLAFLRRAGFTNLTDPYEGSTVEQMLADLERVRIKRPKLRYSNFGAALLGQALAARVGAPYEQLVHERVLDPLGIAEVWAQSGPAPAQPHDRRGRPVPPWTLDAYAPAGCLRGTVRGALSLSVACLTPTAAVTLALTPRAKRGPMQAGLGWMRSPVARGTEMWWHNGGTHGSRSFTGFVPATGVAVAAVTNSPKSPDHAARQAATQPSS